MCCIFSSSMGELPGYDTQALAPSVTLADTIASAHLAEASAVSLLPCERRFRFMPVGTSVVRGGGKGFVMLPAKCFSPFPVTAWVVGVQRERG